jgi:membrane protein
VKSFYGKCKQAIEDVRDFLDEKAIRTVDRAPLSRLHRFSHFWLMVGKSFVRNRCPVHASALAYTTLLALIPMLAVAISVSSGILKKEGGQRITKFIDHLVMDMTPPMTNTPTADNSENGLVIAPAISPDTNSVPGGRTELARNINSFINNIQGGALGMTGGALLVFMIISMLARIEGTFNDIWGVARGRSWPARIVQYSAVIFLGPLLLALALGLISGPHLNSTKHLIESMPFVGGMLFRILPALVLCLGFSFFYMLMPNTKVHPGAALVGGAVGGLLWHINNVLSVVYVSRWVTNSQIYGKLAVIPVFMVGLYFSWLIVLFGAQVSYAFQNRAAYRQEKLAENINQRGREFIALRLMDAIGQRFQRGETPATVVELADGLVVPSRLVQQILQTLMAARLVIEVAGNELAYAPARPLDAITCHDILLALRAGQGQELATREDAVRAEVYGEFTRILEAERKAASSVTVLAMVNRTEKLMSGHRLKAVADGKTD